jgi:biopolymer transport protein ExbD
MGHAHRHLGAEAVVTGEIPHATSDMNVTPMIDVLSVNRTDVTIAELEPRLRTMFDQRRDKTKFIMAAGSLPYSDIVDVIDAARGAGVVKVGIVTEAMRKAGTATRNN